jgi:hypothetical protein
MSEKSELEKQREEKVPVAGEEKESLLLTKLLEILEKEEEVATYRTKLEEERLRYELDLRTKELSLKIYILEKKVDELTRKLEEMDKRTKKLASKYREMQEFFILFMLLKEGKTEEARARLEMLKKGEVKNE